MFNRRKKRGKELDNKEQIYNEVIKPLVDHLYDVAKECGIPFVAGFEVSERVIVGGFSLTESKTSPLQVAALVLEGDVSIGMETQRPMKVHD